jgi:hypothetical protein
VSHGRRAHLLGLGLDDLHLEHQNMIATDPARRCGDGVLRKDFDERCSLARR